MPGGPPIVVFPADYFLDLFPADYFLDQLPADCFLDLFLLKFLGEFSTIVGVSGLPLSLSMNLNRVFFLIRTFGLCVLPIVGYEPHSVSCLKVCLEY